MARGRWDERPLVKSAEVGDHLDLWFRGCFRDLENWDGVHHWRDFDELRRRDLALYALGDVVGKSVLDVACGGGVYMVVLARLGAEVSGQDLSPETIEKARLALERTGVEGELRSGDATARLDFPDDTFDAVFSADFVEHITLAQKRSFVAEVRRVLKPGGRFVIKTPNLTYLRLTNRLRRIGAPFRGRSPFSIHIAHTRDNPDREHHGLAGPRTYRDLLLDETFHTPEFIPQPLSRRRIPRFLQEKLPRMPVFWPWFNQNVIVCARKPVFLGMYP